MGKAAFADRLRNFRQQQGLTQAELASRSHVSLDAVRRLEHARYSPTLDTITKLSDGLGISIQRLIAEEAGERVGAFAEVDDCLRGRSDPELRLALRVLHALFLRPRVE